MSKVGGVVGDVLRTEDVVGKGEREPIKGSRILVFVYCNCVIEGRIFCLCNFFFERDLG